MKDQTYKESLNDKMYDVYMKNEARKKKRENDWTKRFYKLIKSDEQKKITKYGEGFCYGCSEVRDVISSLFFVCNHCAGKRGTEGLIKNNTFCPREELCDVCGYWKYMDVWQRNINMCGKCCDRTIQIHNKYRKTGGITPAQKKQDKLYGKNWQQEMKSTFRK